jgi:hypothetical protein
MFVIFYLEFSDEEINALSLNRVEREVKCSILGSCSFASFFQKLV